MMEPEFIPGLELSRRFYQEVVAPTLEAHFPGLKYSAALIGVGSEVLGYDTPRSTDHDWGPRSMLFLPEEIYVEQSPILKETLSRALPKEFRGYPIIPRTKTHEAVGVQVLTIRGFVRDYLGFDIQQPIGPADWMTFPQQKLLGLTQGAVFWDEAGLETVRLKFEFYPNDVWLYLLAASWKRISQEESLMGRAGQVGDEVGSALIAARLVHDIMRLWFLMERKYAPYPKWFGSAFAHLPGAESLIPLFQRTLSAEKWEERQEHLVQAYELTAVKHNSLRITSPVRDKRSYFHDRPILVIEARDFANALCAEIVDPAVKKWTTADRLVGNIDQFSDSTDLIVDTRWRPILRKLYE